MSTSLVTATTTGLLAGLAEGAGNAAWKTLDSRMRPVFVATALRLGLNRDEAEEAGQQALARIFESYRAGKFHGGKGKLRRWMTVIARNAAVDVMRRRGRPQGHEVAEIPDEHRVTAIISEEWRRTALRQALDILRSSSQFDQRTLRAFELLVVYGVPVAEVASQCEMTEAQAYVAKSRVRGRFLEIFNLLTASGEEAES